MGIIQNGGKFEMSMKTIFWCPILYYWFAAVNFHFNRNYKNTQWQGPDKTCLNGTDKQIPRR